MEGEEEGQEREGREVGRREEGGSWSFTLGRKKEN